MEKGFLLRIISWIFSVGLTIIISANSSQSSTLNFDFDSGIDSNFSIINTGEIWIVDNDGPSLRISKDVDDGSINGNGFITGGISTNFLLGGDFSATVDFHLFNFPATPEPGLYNEVIFRASKQDGEVFQIFRLRSGNFNRTNVFSSPPDSVLYNSTLGENDGSFRLSRTGDVISAQYSSWGSSLFTTFATTNNFSDPIQLSLMAVQGRGPNDDFRSKTAMDISFDNLTIEADNIVSPIPEPTTMLLLGTGLVGVAGAARRRKR